MRYMIHCPVSESLQAVQQATMSDHQPTATVPDTEQSSFRLGARYTSLVMIFAFTLLFPIAATICAVAVIFFRWRWRRIPYDPDVPPKSRYFGTLKPPQHELEDICAHCRDDFVDPLELHCGHVYCTVCIRCHIEYQQTRCPLCNRPQFTLVEPWAVLFVRLGSGSTIAAIMAQIIMAQIIAMIVGTYQSDSRINVNPWPDLNLLNIFLMSSVCVLLGAADYEVGDEWIANVAFPVTMSLAWLAFTLYFAAQSTTLLQLSFWDWSLLGVRRFLG